MSAEEKGLFLGYMMRAEVSSKLPGLTGGKISWEGKTVGQMIEEQKKFKAHQKAEEAKAERLAAEAKAREEALAPELRKMINLSVYSVKLKSMDEYNIRKMISIKCAYENTGAQAIRAFQGTIVFLDLFGDVIMKSGIKVTDPIAAGAKGEWEGGINYDELRDEHAKLANTDLKDMKIEWIPRTVIFEDGTKLGEDAREE